MVVTFLTVSLKDGSDHDSDHDSVPMPVMLSADYAPPPPVKAWRFRQTPKSDRPLPAKSGEPIHDYVLDVQLVVISVLNAVIPKMEEARSGFSMQLNPRKFFLDFSFYNGEPTMRFNDVRVNFHELGLDYSVSCSGQTPPASLQRFGRIPPTSLQSISNDSSDPVSRKSAPQEYKDRCASIMMHFMEDIALYASEKPHMNAGESWKLTVENYITPTHVAQTSQQNGIHKILSLRIASKEPHRQNLEQAGMPPLVSRNDLTRFLWERAMSIHGHLPTLEQHLKFHSEKQPPPFHQVARTQMALASLRAPSANNLQTQEALLRPSRRDRVLGKIKTFLGV
jgi:hypothetical protein